jgi:hypothetical protein
MISFPWDLEFETWYLINPNSSYFNLSPLFPDVCLLGIGKEITIGLILSNKIL